MCRTHGGSVAHVRRAAQQRMDNLAFEAVARIEQLLNSADERVQLKVARVVLGLAGIEPGGRGVSAQLHTADKPPDELTRHEIDRLIAAAQEVGLATPGGDAERYAV